MSHERMTRGRTTIVQPKRSHPLGHTQNLKLQILSYALSQASAYTKVPLAAALSTKSRLYLKVLVKT